MLQKTSFTDKHEQTLTDHYTDAYITTSRSITTDHDIY